MSRRAWTWTKRRRPESQSDSSDSVGIEMVTAALYLEAAPESVFDMDVPADRERLLRLMWSGEYESAVGAQLRANPQLVEQLRMLVSNAYKQRERSAEHEFSEHLKLEGSLSDLVRNQSQKQMTIWTALSSVEARRFQCSNELWDWLRLMHPGLLATQTWVDKLIAEAPKFDPGCPYSCIDDVHAAIFDNYSRKCQYKALATTNAAGYRLDMTNWGTFGIPTVLQPPNFSATSACVRALYQRLVCALMLCVRTQFNLHGAQTSLSVSSPVPFSSPTAKSGRIRQNASLRICDGLRVGRCLSGRIM